MIVHPGQKSVVIDFKFRGDSRVRQIRPGTVGSAVFEAAEQLLRHSHSNAATQLVDTTFPIPLLERNSSHSTRLWRIEKGRRVDLKFPAGADRGTHFRGLNVIKPKKKPMPNAHKTALTGLRLICFSRVNVPE